MEVTGWGAGEEGKGAGLGGGGEWCNSRPEGIRRWLINSGLHHPGQSWSPALRAPETLAAEAAAAPHTSGRWGPRPEPHPEPSSAAAE